MPPAECVEAAQPSRNLVLDLNADLGEGMGSDAAILDIVTSASIACGGHRGDEASMRIALTLAKDRAVAVGAHPSYLDWEGFGRRRLEVEPRVLADQVLQQVRALHEVAEDVGVRIAFLKAHGALYNVAMIDDGVASLVLDVAEQALASVLPVLGLRGSRLQSLAVERGVPFVLEAFSDRVSQPDGTLRPRTEPGAVLTDPLEVARLAPIQATRAETLCVHGDGPHALALAQAARQGLLAAGYTLRSFTSAA